MTNKRFLVTGAAGQLGRLVITELLKTQDAKNIIAVSRDPAQLQDLAAKGIETRKGSFDDSVDALADAVRGASSVLIISTDALDGVGTRVKQHANAVEAVKRAGAEHIVYTSLTKTEPGNPITFAGDHYGTEQAIAKSGLAYTVLRNNWYSEMVAHAVLDSAKAGAIYSATGGKGLSSISRADCAVAAAAALVRGAHGKEILEMTGTTAVTFDELAKLASAATGTEVKHVQLDRAGFLQGLQGAGVPAPMAAVFASFHDAIADGHLGIVSNDFKNLTGRAPTPIESYVNAH